ncbi:hypothetical protein L1987_76447 [Smallanthus sonchifolius]|uniref:Uncharacterized protein n=1 Tax=Smallanthus sonchifolius TaxID=185202 RepID=A0ACB8Z8A9_9ASTR|nr:hypothetical protein L1987_76447 [Smallanthus sonchifolius]
MDATLDYDSLAASGWVLGVLTPSDVPESTLNACCIPRTYAFQRTSLLVKVVANLTCFIPDLCKVIFSIGDKYVSRSDSRARPKTLLLQSKFVLDFLVLSDKTICVPQIEFI